MTKRHTLASLAFGAATLLGLSGSFGCSSSHGGGTTPAPDSGATPATPAPDGVGVCCPVADFTGCRTGTSLDFGGWAATEGDCSPSPSGNDGPPLVLGRDSRDCPALVDGEGCCGCVAPPVDSGVDAPPTVIDGGPPAACEGLGVSACMAAGCVPTYDDTCCPLCDPGGGCADCSDIDFYACRSFSVACEGDGCAFPAERDCSPVGPNCVDARPTDEDSCSIAGCIPAVGPVGSPDRPALCIAVGAQSCAPVSCRALPPMCPPGTTAEADGSCWTGRCIPASVCD